MPKEYDPCKVFLDIFCCSGVRPAQLSKRFVFSVTPGLGNRECEQPEHSLLNSLNSEASVFERGRWRRESRGTERESALGACDDAAQD